MNFSFQFGDFLGLCLVLQTLAIAIAWLQFQDFLRFGEAGLPVLGSLRLLRLSDQELDFGLLLALVGQLHPLFGNWTVQGLHFLGQFAQLLPIAAIHCEVGALFQSVRMGGDCLGTDGLEQGR